MHVKTVTPSRSPSSSKHSYLPILLSNNQPTTTDVATIYCHSKTTNIVDSKMARYCSFYIVDALNPCKINMICVA